MAKTGHLNRLSTVIDYGDLPDYNEQTAEQKRWIADICEREDACRPLVEAMGHCLTEVKARLDPKRTELWIHLRENPASDPYVATPKSTTLLVDVQIDLAEMAEMPLDTATMGAFQCRIFSEAVDRLEAIHGFPAQELRAVISKFQDEGYSYSFLVKRRKMLGDKLIAGIEVVARPMGGTVNFVAKRKDGSIFRKTIWQPGDDGTQPMLIRRYGLPEFAIRDGRFVISDVSASAPEISWPLSSVLSEDTSA